MKTRQQYVHLLVFILFATLLLAGCQPVASVVPTETSAATATQIVRPSATPTETLIPTATETVAPSLTPEPTPIVLGPNDFPQDVNPLTGLQVENPQLLNRRPVMIKVSNFPRDGRPHAGLSSADIVFDYFIGEGTNRFLALFYGKDTEKAGPIRSGRLVDGQLVNMYQGILGFAGADQWTVFPFLSSILGPRAITQSPNTCPAICSDGPQTVTSVFADTAALTQFAEQTRNTAAPNVKQFLEGNVFNSNAPETGSQADALLVQFNILNLAEWRYDPSSGQYLRWIESMDQFQNISMTPLTDRNTGEQLAFSNVIILFAPYTQRAAALHEIGMWNNLNGLRAVLFRDGKALEGIWKSASTD
ncbi:MAG TPA: DUF3048 domain-containing protein, partial [Levilinea sp.]|nr:DUF3048 domain-containing protein [Levilinea sp.]